MRNGSRDSGGGGGGADEAPGTRGCTDSPGDDGLINRRVLILRQLRIKQLFQSKIIVTTLSILFVHNHAY